jgi:hypothetical protein
MPSAFLTEGGIFCGCMVKLRTPRRLVTFYTSRFKILPITRLRWYEHSIKLTLQSPLIIEKTASMQVACYKFGTSKATRFQKRPLSDPKPAHNFGSVHGYDLDRRGTNRLSVQIGDFYISQLREAFRKTIRVPVNRQNISYTCHNIPCLFPHVPRISHFLKIAQGVTARLPISLIYSQTLLWIENRPTCQAYRLRGRIASDSVQSTCSFE